MNRHRPPPLCLVAARDGVTFPAKILGEVPFHLLGGFEWHRVEVFEQGVEQTAAMVLDDGSVLVAAAMVLKPFLGRETGHTDVHARLGRVSSGVCGPDPREGAHDRIQFHDVDVVVMVRSARKAAAPFTGLFRSDAQAAHGMDR